MEVTDSRLISAGGRQRPGALAVRRPYAERPPSVRYTFADDALASHTASSGFIWSSKLVRLGSLNPHFCIRFHSWWLVD